MTKVATAAPEAIQTEIIPTVAQEPTIVHEATRYEVVPIKAIHIEVVIAEAINAEATSDPEPPLVMMNEQVFMKLEGTDESVAFLERIATFEQSTHPVRSASPYGEPTTAWIQTPLWKPTPI